MARLSCNLANGKSSSSRLHTLLSVIVLIAHAPSAESFAVSSSSSKLTRRPTTTSSYAKKGFGNDEKSSKRKKQSDTPQQTNALVDELLPSPAAPVATAATAAATPKVVQTENESNAGQRALAEMRRKRAEEKDSELRRVRDLVAMDQQLQSEPASAAIPEKVAQRMGQRMLPLVGLPLFGSMGTFVAFWYLATYKNLEFDTSLVAISTIGILVVGLLGITYAVMSASWDPDREGSALGMDEFQKNVQNIQDGFGRSRDNAVLREKMTGLSATELQAALTDLEQRERAAQKKQSSLDDKLRNELE